MATKYHPKWKITVKWLRVAEERKRVIERDRIYLKDCPACSKRCQACGWPFTLSTALARVDETLFCTQYCSKRYSNGLR